METLRRVWRWLLLVVSPARTESPTENRKRERGRQSGLSRSDLRWKEVGEFYFRHAILDQLKDYFDILKRMKKASRDQYEFFRRRGIHIVPCQDFINGRMLQTLAPWWLRTRPAFGGIVFGLNPVFRENQLKDGGMIPRMVFFRKYIEGYAPLTVQPARGDIYVVTVYWDTTWEAKQRASPTEYAVSLSETGRVRLLKACMEDVQEIQVKRRDEGVDRRRKLIVSHQKWQHDPFFVRWAQSHDTPVTEYLAALFRFTAETYVAANSSMIRVRVIKGRITAVFGVDITRTPYFFNDRDKTFTAGGKRKRIFHIVRTHPRKLAGGEIVSVRTHFRGERDFYWNGYRAKISVPGWHHMDLTDYNVGGIDQDALETLDPDHDRGDIIDSGQVATLLDRYESEPQRPPRR